MPNVAISLRMLHSGRSIKSEGLEVLRVVLVAGLRRACMTIRWRRVSCLKSFTQGVKYDESHSVSYYAPFGSQYQIRSVGNLASSRNCQKLADDLPMAVMFTIDRTLPM